MNVDVLMKVLVGAIVFIATSAYVLSGNSDIVLKKEHRASAPEWLEKNSNQVTRELYEINQ
jgi:hypothetical protein